MDIQYTVKGITEEELSTLCSLLEGAPEMHLAMDKETYAKYRTEDDCLEDAWARAILNGEKVYFIDDSVTSEDEAIEPAEGVEIDTEVDQYGDFIVKYALTLENILKGLSSEEAQPYVRDFIEENDDMWTAYNLFQIIAFGEIIYG